MPEKKKEVPKSVETFTPHNIVPILQAYVNAESSEAKSNAFKAISAFVSNYFTNIQPRDLDYMAQTLKGYFDQAYNQLPNSNLDTLRTEVDRMIDIVTTCAGMAQTPGMWGV